MCIYFQVVVEGSQVLYLLFLWQVYPLFENFRETGAAPDPMITASEGGLRGYASGTLAEVFFCVARRYMHLHRSIYLASRGDLQGTQAPRWTLSSLFNNSAFDVTFM